MDRSYRKQRQKLTRNFWWQLRALVPLWILSACASGETVQSDQVSQETIYQIYSVSYDQEDQSLEVSAQFRVGGPTGTSLELISPSQIEYNGGDLSISSNSLTGTRYSLTMEDSSFVPTHEWTYTNNDNETFTNQIEIPEIGIDGLSVNIRASEDLEIEWDGDVLADQESVRLEIRDQADFLVTASALNEGASSVTMSKEDLQLLQEGLVRIRLVRYRSIALQEAGPEGGIITAEYRTRLSSANLIP